MALDADDKAARQAFYSKPAGDIAAGEFAFNVDLLARIVTDVRGLPGFGEHTGAGAMPIADAIRSYFASGEPILRKLAGDAIDRYNVISQPAEFFR